MNDNCSLNVCRGSCVLSVAVLMMAPACWADDWPQWLGPSRNDVWTETGILEKFPDTGAQVVWRSPIAGGYSGPAVADGKVYVTDFVVAAGEVKNDPSARAELKGKERVLCLNAADGKPLWTHEYACDYVISYPAGPRTTPAVAAGKVYTLGAEGNLLCLDATSGQLLWSKDLRRTYKTESPIWGFCGHPLIDGQKLICLVGGEGSVAVAFDKDTGRELWRSLSSTPDSGYCPPTIIEAGGQRQLLIWHPQALNGLDPETGKVLWSEPLDPQYGMSCSTPQKAGDFLYVSGIGNCAALFKLRQDKPAVEEVWTGKPTSAVFCSNSTPQIDGETIFGNDCQTGSLRAVKLSTGQRLWETFAPTSGGERRQSHGNAFITKNADRYFLFSETGDLVIARLTPEKYEEISRAHVIEPTNEAFGRRVVWSHPAYAMRSAFIRNDKEIIRVNLAK